MKSCQEVEKQTVERLRQQLPQEEALLLLHQVPHQQQHRVHSLQQRQRQQLRQQQLQHRQRQRRRQRQQLQAIQEELSLRTVTNKKKLKKTNKKDTGFVKIRYLFVREKVFIFQVFQGIL